MAVDVTQNFGAMEELLTSAIDYRLLGYSIIPIQVSKRSLSYWKVYQNRQMSEREIRFLFSHPLSHGIAVVCGAISANLEVIDLDSKNDLSGKLMVTFCKKIKEDYPDLFNKLVIAGTRNAGYHFLYKCENSGRNAILARRPATPQEQANNPHVKVKVLIETKANGGYAIIYPTAGYRFLRGSMDSIQVITSQERGILLNLAKSFNTMPDLLPSSQPGRSRYFGKHSPCADFDARGDLTALLLNHGWTLVKETPERNYFRRPGETDHWSSGDFHHQKGLFAVFTTSTEFIPQKGYRPYAVFAVLECGGDLRVAAKKLLAAGFGRPYWPREP